MAQAFRVGDDEVLRWLAAVVNLTRGAVVILPESVIQAVGPNDLLAVEYNPLDMTTTLKLIRNAHPVHGRQERNIGRGKSQGAK